MGLSKQKLQNCLPKIKIGQFIGAGSFGAVYTLLNYKNRVIKFGLEEDLEDNFNNIVELTKTFNYIKTNKPATVAKVYDFERFDCAGVSAYYYIMEKLNTIPKDIRLNYKLIDVIESLCNDKKTDATPIFCKKMGEFISKTRKMKYYHDDMHGENIMIDNRGNYKLVDLESLLKK